MNNKIKVTFDDSRSLEVYYKTKAIDVVKMVEGDTSDILALNINNECSYQSLTYSTPKALNTASSAL